MLLNGALSSFFKACMRVFERVFGVYQRICEGLFYGFYKGFRI